MDELQIIKKIIQEAVGESLSKIILFGSRARGDNRPDSDYDLLVIVKKNLDKKKKQSFSKSIREMTAKYLIPIDILVRSEEENESFSKFIGTLSYDISREGIVI